MPDRLNLSSLVVRLSALLMLWTGCADATRPTDPPAPPPASPPAAPPIAPVAPPNAPPLFRPGVYYERVSPSFIPGSSRYAIHDDSTFSLLYDAHGGLEYPGRFSRKDAQITFYFDGWSVAGPWIAHGTLLGDSLIVEYNEIMMMSDFEDGTYIRSAGQ